MKKRILSFVGLSAMALLLVMSSCKKNETADALVIDQTKTCTLTGHVYAILNMVDFMNDNNYQNVPSGTTMYFKVYNNYYLSSASGFKMYSTTVGGDGTYSVAIPVSPIGTVNVTVSFSDFQADQTQAKWDVATSKYVADGTERKIYHMSDVSETISHEGTELTGDYFYSYSNVFIPSK